MDPDMLTISPETWMSLPTYPVRLWKEENGIRDSSYGRFTAAKMAQYCFDCVTRRQLLPRYFFPVTVTDVSRVSEMLWRIKAECKNGQQVIYFAHNVALCVGSSGKPSPFKIPGVHLPIVIRTYKEFQELLKYRGANSSIKKVLIVGCGLSAADSVLASIRHGIQVLHAFRKRADDPLLTLARLTDSHYPEYRRVLRMMRSGKHDYYQSFPQHQLMEVQEDGLVKLVGPEGERIFSVSYVVVLVGSSPDLSFLENGGIGLELDSCKSIFHQNPLNTDIYSHEIPSSPGLYAVGSLTGEKLVRYSIGGALAVASDLVKKRKGKESQNILDY